MMINLISPSPGRGDGGWMRQHDRKMIEFAWIPEAFAGHGISTHRDAHVGDFYMVCHI